MSSHIFRGHLRYVNRINEGHYLCYPAILTNTLVPQANLSSILQNQLGVALDALTHQQGQVIYTDGSNFGKIIRNPSPARDLLCLVGSPDRPLAARDLP